MGGTLHSLQVLYRICQNVFQNQYSTLSDGTAVRKTLIQQEIHTKITPKPRTNKFTEVLSNLIYLKIDSLTILFILVNRGSYMIGKIQNIKFIKQVQ